jgi:hypothetical protein
LEPDGPLDIDVVAQRKVQGILPSVPEKYSMSNKTSFQGLYYATMSCFRPDPAERLTTYELARALDLVLVAIKNHRKISREHVQAVFQKGFHRFYRQSTGA